jgi:predicted helicase
MLIHPLWTAVRNSHGLHRTILPTYDLNLFSPMQRAIGLKSQIRMFLHCCQLHLSKQKIRFLIKVYEGEKSNANFDVQIKWSETLKRRLEAGQQEPIDRTRTRNVLYRPYTNRRFYDSALFVDRPRALDKMFPAPDIRNRSIFVAIGRRGHFSVCAAGLPVSLDFFVPNAACLFPRKRFGKSGHSLDNITDWVLEKFRAYYEKDQKPKRPINKDAIFHYVYGVLHDPIYREKYALNLKREFPCIPLYADFWRWAEWGEKLMELHIGYEKKEKSRKTGLAPKAMLRADKDIGNIQLDSDTQLSGFPLEAWAYRLGNRSALEWILDQYKEKTPKDPTIREKFNTYRFADYKEKVIDLLKRVTRVSIER